MQLGKACSRISDLKVEQLAIILQVHDTLTSQTLFSMGGELLEVHRRALSLQKRQEDGSHRGLEIRVEVSKRMGWSEKRWGERLVSILKQGLFMNKYMCKSLFCNSSFAFHGLQFDLASVVENLQAMSTYFELSSEEM